MSSRQYGDYQLDIYFEGLKGQLPTYPVDFAALERAAALVLPRWVHSYVAGGAGDETTQRGNVEAFSRYGIVPRMLVGASERDLSVSLFDMDLPTPLFMCPIGVIGICAQDFHGDIATAKASAQTSVPMVASTLTQDRMEDVIPHAGDTPGLFQLYTPTDKDLAASFLAREVSGVQGPGRPHARRACRSVPTTTRSGTSTHRGGRTSRRRCARFHRSAAVAA
jgi:lactate 2-monooxygenase